MENVASIVAGLTVMCGVSLCAFTIFAGTLV